MVAYEQKVMHELRRWQQKMLRKPGYFNRLSKALQDKLNSWIPEKVHRAITETIKQMIRGVLFGARWTTGKKETASLEETDRAAEDKIKFYQTTAAAEGAITGAGGILLGLADFPLLSGRLQRTCLSIAHFPIGVLQRTTQEKGISKHAELERYLHQPPRRYSPV